VEEHAAVVDSLLLGARILVVFLLLVIFQPSIALHREAISFRVFDEKS